MNRDQLIALCYKKNQLNLKRRRFYVLAFKITESTHISQTDAFSAYRRIQKELKQLTTPIKALRKAFCAKLIWDSSGNIGRIRWIDGTFISKQHFEDYYNSYIMETILLTDNKILEVL